MADGEMPPAANSELTDDLKEKILLSLFGDSLGQALQGGPDGPPGDNKDQHEDATTESPKAEQSATDVTVDQPGTEKPGTEKKPKDDNRAEQKSAAEDAPAQPAAAAASAPVPEKSAHELAVEKIQQLEDQLRLEEDGLSQDRLEERHKEAQELKATANNLYKDGQFSEAVAQYTKALQLCPLKQTKDRSVLYANRAAAIMGAELNKEALPDLDKALELDAGYVKALERRARLNKLLERLDDALKDYERLDQLKPKHCEYVANVRDLKERIRVRDEEMKAKMIESLKQLGNVFLKPFGLSTDSFNMVPNENGGYNLQMGGQQNTN